MATICKDCIQAVGLDTQAGTTPCSGLIVNFTVDTGRLGQSETAILDPVSNPLSLIGYDYFFQSKVTGEVYNIIYGGGQWVILNSKGVKVYYSSDAGSNNNLCPPVTGWTNINGEFSDFSITREVLPGPSDPCSVTNGTFDSNTTGWTVSNGAWDSYLGGSVKFDSALLGSLSQANVLTVGETYDISLKYSTSTRAGYCTPTQISSAYIKVYAGTKVYTAPVDDTSGTFKALQVELTCEGNSTLKVEVYDPNQCFGTVAGGKGKFIDEVCAVLKTNVGDPTGPSPLPKMQYLDMAEVPAQINKTDYNTKLVSFQECLATKGTTFYNKVVGGVKCDHRELSKLKLIIELLAQKNEDRALDCVYDRQAMPTAVYPDLPTGTLTVSTANQKVVTITGDLSQFETFNLSIPALSNFVSVIINAVYDSALNQTTITVANNFPSTISNTPYEVKFESEVETSYLETFINFANQFCADCITTGQTSREGTPAPPSLEIPQVPLNTESGIPITTEFNQQITI